MAELKLEKRMADVLWTMPDGQIIAEQCIQGVPWVWRHISDSPHAKTATNVQVRWVAKAIKIEEKDGQKTPAVDALGNPVYEERERVLLNCAPDKVSDALTKAQEEVGRRPLPPTPMAALYTLISRLMEAWDIRGVILTLLAGDERVEGFGLITETAPVTEQNIILLAESAQNHVDGFKAEMRKKHDIMFLGDRGKIIVPGQ